MGTDIYYNSFIDRFAYITTPIVDLPKKGIHFEWSPDQQTSFDNLKQRLKSAPIL